MSDKIARVCDHCGKTDVVTWHADSNGMVLVSGKGCSLLLMRDVKPGEPCRPTFTLSGKHFCPTCFIEAVQGWLREVS